MIEGSCIVKHKNHVCYLSGVPYSNRFVKGRCSTKHISHVCHLRGVPFSNGLIKGSCFLKHRSHGCHLRGVPAIKGLIKRICLIKHIIHVSHLRGVPTLYGTIESRTSKSFSHVSNTTSVPAIEVVRTIWTRTGITSTSFDQIFEVIATLFNKRTSTRTITLWCCKMPFIKFTR